MRWDAKDIKSFCIKIFKEKLGYQDVIPKTLLRDTSSEDRFNFQEVPVSLVVKGNGIVKCGVIIIEEYDNVNTIFHTTKKFLTQYPYAKLVIIFPEVEFIYSEDPLIFTNYFTIFSIAGAVNGEELAKRIFSF